MKKLLLLLPAALAMLLFSGCAEDYHYYGHHSYGGGPVYGGRAFYDDGGPYGADYGPVVDEEPYYVYGGVTYFFVDGRYYHKHGGHRVYVTELPRGGRYIARAHARPGPAQQAYTRTYAPRGYQRGAVTYHQQQVSQQKYRQGGAYAQGGRGQYGHVNPQHPGPQQRKAPQGQQQTQAKKKKKPDDNH